VDIGVTNPYCAISDLENAPAKLNVISIIRKVLVEAAELFPETTPYEKSKSRDPRKICDNQIRAFS
jgi:hypothetical protein